MTKNATYCDQHVSSRKCIFFVVTVAMVHEEASGEWTVATIQEEANGERTVATV